MHLDPKVSRVLGIIGILIAGALAVYIAYLYVKPHGSSEALIPPDTRLVLSASDLPAHDALIIGMSHKSLAPVNIPSQGTQNIYAEALGKNYAYYLISGPMAGESTLYRLDQKHPEAGLEQLTQSNSEKLDLSVHEAAGLAVFAAQVNGKPHVVVLDMKSGKETDLGEGVHPHILAAGLNVLFEKNGSLVSEEIASGKIYPLAKIAPAAPFAVDAFKSQFALYDSAANAVKTYLIVNDATAAQEASSGVPGEKPDALLYSGDTLLMARMVQDMLVVSSIDGLHDEQIRAPGFSLMGFSIHVL